jgi:hypothetical protein
MIQSMRPFLPLLMLACLLVSGCAHYEYDIIRPQDLTAQVGTKEDVVFTRDPLEYRLRTVDNRLVMRIYNPTDAPITLLGDRSSVVDAGGQSHPLPSMTAAPQSFIKLILPPLRPYVERPSPSLEFGVGTVVSRNGHTYYHPGAPYYRPPQYMAAYDVDSALYWDWSGETQIRMTLVFEQAEKTFEQEFAIQRRKM